MRPYTLKAGNTRPWSHTISTFENGNWFHLGVAKYQKYLDHARDGIPFPFRVAGLSETRIQPKRIQCPSPDPFLESIWG